MYRVPQVLERLGRHIRMSDQVVIAPYQLAFAIAADRDESGVGIGDNALSIGLGHKDRVFRKRDFFVRHRFIDLHYQPRKGVVIAGC